MYKVFYEANVINGLKKFIDSYKSSFIRLIEDSGLTVEDELIKNYILLGNNLYKSIIDKVEEALKQEIILGRVLSESNMYHIIIKVNNFRIFVYYKDYISLNKRNIVDIEFFRK